MPQETLPTPAHNKTLKLYAYIDNKKCNVGYAYLTKNGSLCIKGSQLLDKSKLGKLLVQGLYVMPDQSM